MERRRSDGDRDRAWMTQALALGALVEGTTSPNPRVGCVVVRDGAVVGRGYHLEPGGPHAEVVAVQEAGPRARGAALYVNLEPCAHRGRTPPCAELIVRSGIRRVIASMTDPNPLVDGRGFDLLRESGVDVEVGLLAGEAERVNDSFVHWHRRARPLVTLKAAMSMDGMLSADRGVSRWITGAAARRFAHRLRLRADSVIVGAGTVRNDDPRLTVRLPGVRRSPRRVVLSASLDLDPGAKVFLPDPHGAPRTRVYTTSGASPSRAARLADRAEIVTVIESASGGVDLRAVLQNLGEQGVQSVLVEGGGETFAAFLSAGLADRGALFHSSSVVGARGATPFVDGPAVAEPGEGWRLVERRVLSFGEDLLAMGRLVRTREPSRERRAGPARRDEEDSCSPA